MFELFELNSMIEKLLLFDQFLIIFIHPQYLALTQVVKDSLLFAIDHISHLDSSYQLACLYSKLLYVTGVARQDHLAIVELYYCWLRAR